MFPIPDLTSALRMTRTAAAGVVCLTGACAATGPAQQQSDVSEADRAQPDAVLLWGVGVYQMDLRTGAVTTWIDAQHVLDDVCWAADHGGGTDTVFVLADGQVTRLYADTGAPVRLLDELPDDPRAVNSGHVIDLASSGAVLSAIGLDRSQNDGAGGRPYWSGSYTSMAWSNADDDPRTLGSFAMYLMPTSDTWLDAVPDRHELNDFLLRNGRGCHQIFVQLQPEDRLGPRLWSPNESAPRPLAAPADPPAVTDLVVATQAPRAIATMSGRSLRFDFPEGLASGTWTIVGQPEGSWEPRILLCTADGTRFLAVDEGLGVARMIDAMSGEPIMTLAVEELSSHPWVVPRAASLVGLPHDQARHTFTPRFDGDVCLRDDAWICGLITDCPACYGERSATHVAVWDLSTGALLKCFQGPKGVRGITTLPQDTTPVTLTRPANDEANDRAPR
ncbi:MAG TPA: hypothetical protein VFD43_09795 [Planctomycetota bacterium]|nr:hypothetical protein [Planctomycetota bacterium]